MTLCCNHFWNCCLYNAGFRNRPACVHQDSQGKIQIVTEPLSYDFTAARSILLEGSRWFALLDVLTLLGVDPSAPDIYPAFLAVPEADRRIQNLFALNGATESMPVVTVAGLAAFLAASPQPAVRAYVTRNILDAVRRQTSISSPSGGATRWGEQPFRELVRRHHLSMSEFTRLVNKQVPAGERKITQASVSAVAMGRQLPNPVLLNCLIAVLQAPASELFDDAVCQAYFRKNGVALKTGLELPAPAQELRSLPPFAAPEPDEEDEPPIDWDEEDRKAEAAMREAFGAAAFQTGFNTVIGSDSSPSESSLPAPEDLDPSV